MHYLSTFMLRTEIFSPSTNPITAKSSFYIPTNAVIPYPALWDFTQNSNVLPLKNGSTISRFKLFRMSYNQKMARASHASWPNLMLLIYSHTYIMSRLLYNIPQINHLIRNSFFYSIPSSKKHFYFIIISYPYALNHLYHTNYW